MPADNSSLLKFFGLLRGPARPIKSFYLPATPPRKFPPRRLPRLHNEVIIRLICEAGMQTVFPFLFGQTDGYPNDVASFDEVIKNMSTDRLFVIKRPIKIDTSSDPPLYFTLHTTPPSTASTYNFLIDLLGQLVSHRQQLKVEFDEIGAYWVRLRNATPYREHAFYKDVTVHVHHIFELVAIVYAETDEDIDAQYQYGWMGEFVRKLLEGDSEARVE
jgi:hypothetical protein